MCMIAPGGSTPPGALAVSEGTDSQGLTPSLAAPTVNAGAVTTPGSAPTMSSAGPTPQITAQQILQTLMTSLSPGYRLPNSPQVSMM